MMKYGWITVLAILLVATLAFSAAPLARALDDPPPTQEEPPAEDPPASEPAEDPDGIGQLEEELPETEEDRKIKPRLRPSTDEEERAFKRQATRNDPFLNPLLPLNYERVEGSGYNPRDYLGTGGFLDLSRYIVQSLTGEVQGFLTVHSSIQDISLFGPVMDVVRVCDYEPHRRIELQVQLETMRPTVVQIIPTDESRSQQAMDLGLEEALRAEYLFDRVTIRENVGGITGLERARMLPFSFDINQLDSLVRSIDYDSGNWPLEAFLFDPEERLNNIPMSIEQPRRANMKSAELEDYGCWQLTMRVGNETWQWWVERLAPHRIIRYNDGQRSYTLMSYTQGQ